MNKFLLWTFALLLLQPAEGAALSGTLSVGPTGDYISLSSAISAIQTNGLSGPLVLELQSAYDSSVESFPLTFSNLGTSATNTLTIRPQAGATGLAITSSNSTATVGLNGAGYVTFDGRPAGIGTSEQLTIANTGMTGAALRFNNGSCNNLIRYIRFQGSALSNTSGVVVFAGTSGATGNQNNTIDRCDIGDGLTTPANAVYSAGQNNTLSLTNSGNTISACNIFNFYTTSNYDSAGVRLDDGNTSWTITGNSFYQTATRASVSATVRAICINNTAGNNFTVSNNAIGGSAPNAGGSAWTAASTENGYLFVGIQLSVGTSVQSSVQGNTIQNMVWATSGIAVAQSGVWSGIYVTAGAVNIGTVEGNNIGSSAGTGSVAVTAQSSGGTCYGVCSTSSGVVTIAGNSIGSITVSGTSTSVSASLCGIQVTAGSNVISGNTVGSTTSANSLNAATSCVSAGQMVTGIQSSSSSSTGAYITGNTVANLSNSTVYAGSNAGSNVGNVSGILVSSGANTITGNNVHHLSTTSQNTNAVNTQSVYGIAVLNISSLGQTVSQNTVHSLSNTAATAAVSVTGIYFIRLFNGAGVSTVAQNLVHSLAVSSISPSATMSGMDLGITSSGGFLVTNNMVRVGLDKNGASTAGAATVRGIIDNGSAAGRNFYHNSIYVGGTQTSGASSSYAFTSTGATNSRAFQNNIFVNARSNSGATGKHYAARYGCTTANPTGLTSGGNIFLASGTGGVLGLYNSADCTTLAAWQVATGQDLTSASADPLFINPTGDAVSADLHLQSVTPAEGGALPIPVVATDFDGQTRSDLTPADIGADAGNFTSIGDVFAPAISYPLLNNASAENRVLTGWATIMDNSGSVSGGANAPRLYFKKSTDADVFGVPNDATGNGWKYVAATGSGSYSFTIDYSLVHGGSVATGDTIQYFVIAQDAAGNFASSPAFSTAFASPPVQNVNGHGAVNSFTIFPGSGTVTVGSGGSYPSLSGAGGFLAAINNGALSGNLIVNITSDLTEDGSVTLNPWQEVGAGGYTVTIQPDGATMRTISGDAANGLITLNGADRVTVDGGFNGSGRYLTFRNTSSNITASTLLFINDASNNNVRNCVLEGAGTIYYTGVVSFSTGTLTGNDNNLVTACQVRNLSTTSGVPANLIGSLGNYSPSNSGNIISNNELYNFKQVGIYIDTSGNDSWTISGNNIYEASTMDNSQSGYNCTGISMGAGGANIIKGNYIHDLLTTGNFCYGIYYFGVGTTTIASNRITAFNMNAATTGFAGIGVSGSIGTLNVVNNQVIISPATTASRSLYGLLESTLNTKINAFYNSFVIGGTTSGSANSWCILRNSASTHTARNNLFLNLRTGGTGSHFAAGNQYSIAGSYTVSNNVYAGTGATAANFMDFSGSQSAIPVNFATWQTSTGDTNSQAGIAGTGNFTAAMFVNAANGDLHLVPGGSALVNALGISIAGVTDDYDGDARNPTTPSIGADEFPVPDIAVTQGGALTDGTSTVDFGPVAVGGSSAVLTFTLTNPGGADLSGLAVTIDGTNPGDFSVGTLSSTSIPVGAGTATFSVTFTPAVLGARSAALHIASSVRGTKPPFDITITATGVTAIQGWRQQFFGVTANSGNAADTFDYDRDGLPNLIEWACNLNPTTGSKLPATAVLNGSNVEFTYTRSVTALNAGASFAVEWSDTLANDWQATGVTENILSDDGTMQQVKATLSAGSAGHRFVHLKVTAAP